MVLRRGIPVDEWEPRVGLVYEDTVANVVAVKLWCSHAPSLLSYRANLLNIFCRKVPEVVNVF